MSLTPVHTFQPHVERLREEFNKAGTPKTHAELLHLVATAQGVSSWDRLPQFPKRSWLARKLGGGQGWRRQSVQHLEEVLFDLQLGQLCLGVEADETNKNCLKKVFVDMGWLRRGILMVGPQGWGATTAVEHYAAQQLARGGGLLVLDASPNDEAFGRIQPFASAAGRQDFHHYRHDLPDGEKLSDVKGLLATQAAAYVNLSWTNRSAGEGLRQGEFFVRELLEHARLEDETGNKPCPFMVIVPEGGWLLTEAWLPLLLYARSRGLCLVVRLHSLEELEGMSAGMSDALFNLLGAQLYLAPRGVAAIHATARALQPGLSEGELAETRKRLAALGMGEALLNQWHERPKNVRLCMVLPETREESRAKWDRS